MSVDPQRVKKTGWARVRGMQVQDTPLHASHKYDPHSCICKKKDETEVEVKLENGTQFRCEKLEFGQIFKKLENGYLSACKGWCAEFVFGFEGEFMNLVGNLG